MCLKKGVCVCMWVKGSCLILVFCCSGDNNVKALMFGIKHVKIYF